LEGVAAGAGVVEFEVEFEFEVIGAFLFLWTCFLTTAGLAELSEAAGAGVVGA
jgi:hypothetical protein